MESGWNNIDLIPINYHILDTSFQYIKIMLSLSPLPSSCHHHPADDAGSWTRRCWWNYGKCMKVICVCYIFCSSLINIIIFHSLLDSVADGHCAGADGTWWQLWSQHPRWWRCCQWGNTNMVAALMLVIVMMMEAVTMDSMVMEQCRWRRQVTAVLAVRE